MKKFFTIILFAAGTISFASAQSNHQQYNTRNDKKTASNGYNHHPGFEKNNSVVYNDNYFSYKDKQRKLEMINRQYDQKIISVKRNYRLSGREKVNQIQWLQSQKKNEIAKVEYQFAKSNQRGYSKASALDSYNR